MSRNKGIVDEIVDLTSRSAELGVRLLGLAITIPCRLFIATLAGIDEALKPKEEIKVKPPKKEREEAKEVTKKPSSILVF